MTTTIQYCGTRSLVVECPDINMFFVCDSRDFNKQHTGIWNSRTMSFVPTLTDTFLVGNYDDSYTDNSGIYYERCIVCSVETLGNKYCGPSCEQRFSEEDGL